MKDLQKLGELLDNYNYRSLILLTEKRWEENPNLYLNLINNVIRNYEEEEKYEKCKILLELKKKFETL